MMIGLPAAKNLLRDTNLVMNDFARDAKRLTPEEYEDAQVNIAECRNLLNCIEELLPQVRP